MRIQNKCRTYSQIYSAPSNKNHADILQSNKEPFYTDRMWNKFQQRKKKMQTRKYKNINYPEIINSTTVQ